MTDSNTNRTENNNRRLPKGTLVVNTDDGEPGRIVGVLGVSRFRNEASSYYVETKYGTEVWKANDLFVPEQN